MSGRRSRSIANAKRSEGSSSGRMRRGCVWSRVSARWCTGHSASWTKVSLPMRGPRCGAWKVTLKARMSCETRSRHDCCGGSLGAVASARIGPQVENRSQAMMRRATPMCQPLASAVVRA
eukprot:10211504-Heterocapsa_arctica.AAC.1